MSMTPPTPLLFVADLRRGTCEFEPGQRHERLCELFAHHRGEAHALDLTGAVLAWIGRDDRAAAAELSEALAADPAAALRDLRGTYCGAHRVLDPGRWTFFTDHIGSRPLFYYLDEARFILSSSVAAVARAMREAGLTTKLDRHGAYALLTYGYCVDQLTLVAGVRTLEAGRTLTLDLPAGTVREGRYYRPPVEPSFGGSLEDAAAELDELFVQAVRRAFERDRQAGLRHAVTLSGGLDSRMTALVAQELGYGEQLHLTFSQSGAPDERIARRIAADLGHEWLYYALDGGDYLLAFEALAPLLEGRVVVTGAAHAFGLYRLLDWGALGMLHTGQHGDVVIGRSTARPPRPDLLGTGAMDLQLIDRLADHAPAHPHATPEEHLLANRFFRGNNAALAVAQATTETYAPFTDVDVLDLCLSLPAEYRERHRLYKVWIDRHRRAADRYPWARTGARPTAASVTVGRHAYTANEVVERLRRATGTSNRPGMMPLARYYAEGDRLRPTLDAYAAAELDRLGDDRLRDDAAGLYRHGTATNKLAVVSLLSATKYLLG